LKNQLCTTKAHTTDSEETATLLQSFFNSSPQYQVLLNRQLEIVAFNDSAFHFNRSISPLDLEKGKRIFEYIDRSLCADFRTECLKALQGETVEYEHFIKGGWYYFSITALYDADRQVAGLAIVGNNISSKKESTKIIRQQSECLSVIAQLQSHQVRHPVCSILGLVRLIKEEENYHLNKDYLKALEKATLQLDEIIRAIVAKAG
jgi:hypothetical protein